VGGQKGGEGAALKRGSIFLSWLFVSFLSRKKKSRRRFRNERL